jgi:radical SAM family uncharacterized protein/radical SAM-linked protein
MTCYREIGTVQKPYQYVGHEENSYQKDFDAAAVRLCIAFPDAYEVGMSNVGMQIIYHVVNEQDGFMADRAYAPLVDMGAMLRATGQRLLGRESNRPLSAFDCVGFTLQYELCYTNILYMLDLGGIPRRARDRKAGDPLVMAGGPCVFNPEPVAEFFDFFVVGEGEEAVIDVLSCLETCKARGRSRQATLLELAKIGGVYVPSLYEPEYDEHGRFSKLRRAHPAAPRWVERRIIKDLNTVPYPTAPVTPAIQPIHERISVEIQRGCTRACRFCQAGYIYRPRRERDPNKIFDIIEKSVRATGITDIGLLSLSSADYSHIHPLMKAIMDKYKSEHLSISLPSTRLEALKDEYLDVLKEERRAGFTIAPEAGSQRLRNVINKNFTESEVVETARMLYRNGWQSVKMYFMIGQPTETDEDVIAIAELANTVIRKTSELPGRKLVTISVSNFVPKPHTPFQWHQQISREEILRKQRLVRDHIHFKNLISFRCHSADNSVAEGMVARADRRAAQLIERAYELGAVFDCWQDRFDLKIWLEAARQLEAETGHDFVADGTRGRDLEERLPWHRIYSGLHPKFFKNEWTKAVYGIATEDCSFSACHECGLCNLQNGVKPLVMKDPVAMRPTDGSTSEEAEVLGPAATWRFQYKKVDAGVFITVTDLQNMLLRAFKRAGVRIQYDKGIRPRPKFTMGAALPIGVSSSCELIDITLETSLEPDELIPRLNRFLPEHVAMLTAVKLDVKAPPLPKLVRSLSYQVRLADLAGTGVSPAELQSRVDAINAPGSFLVQRTRKSNTGEAKVSSIDLKESLEALIRDDGHVRFTMYAPNGQSVSPHLVLDALVGPRVNDGRQILIHKTGFLSTAERQSLI